MASFAKSYRQVPVVRLSLGDYALPLLLAGLGLLGLIHSGQIANPRSQVRDQDGLKDEGFLYRTGGTVRQQKNGDAFWRDIEERRERVRNGDALFTGKNGYAKLRYHDGSEVRINPGSLVVIKAHAPAEENVLEKVLSLTGLKSPVKTTFQVARGSITVHVPSGNTSLRVLAGEKSLDVTGEETIAAAPALPPTAVTTEKGMDTEPTPSPALVSEILPEPVPAPVVEVEAYRKTVPDTPPVVAVEEVVVDPEPVLSPPILFPEVAKVGPLAPKFPRTQLGIKLGYEYLRIDSVDTGTGQNGLFLSNLSPALQGSLSQRWGPKWESGLQLNYRSEEIRPATDPDKIILARSGGRYGLSAFVRRHWQPGSSTFLSLGRRQEIFFRSPNTSTVIVDRVDSFCTEAGQNFDLVTHGNLRLGVEGSMHAVLPTQGYGYQTKLGLGAEGLVYVSHQTSAVEFRANLFYRFTHQNSSFVEQRTSSQGGYLGAVWSFE